VSVEYHVPDASGVDRVFTLLTPYSVAILDYGNAALLPHAGGTVFDSRFYFFSDASKERLTLDKGGVPREAKLARWGMSHREPSRHYDALLFSYAVLLELNRGGRGKAVPPPVRAFQEFYKRNLGTVHASDRLMLKKDCAGRLTPAGQRKLMEGCDVPVGRAMMRVSDPAALLMDPYFAAFRSCAGTDTCKLVFGLRPSAAALQPPVHADALARAVSGLAANVSKHAAWEPVLTSKGILVGLPTPGVWATLVARLDSLRATADPGRPMSALEARSWAPSCASALGPSLIVPPRSVIADVDDGDGVVLEDDCEIMENL
jgi:hypothetical protein